MVIIGVLPAIGLLTRVAHFAKVGKNVGTWFAGFIAKHPIITAGVISIPLATEFVKAWNATPDVQKLKAINELSQVNPDLAKSLIEFELRQKEERKLIIITIAIIIILIIVAFIFKK